MIKLPAQRVTLVDNLNNLTTEWYKSLLLLTRSVNNSRFTSSGSVATVTGTTSATVAATIPVNMGNGGSVRLSVGLSSTNNANVKILIVNLGATTIQTYAIDPSTDTQTAQIFIVGRGANDQYTTNLPSVNCVGSGGTESTEDASGNINITLLVQLANSADSVSVESWLLEVEQS